MEMERDYEILKDLILRDGVDLVMHKGGKYVNNECVLDFKGIL